MAAALPVIGAIAGGISAISSIKSMFGGSPKTPSPITPPTNAVPTVNQAAQQADQNSQSAARKGALANLLSPSGTGQQLTAGNTSLRSVLGG